LGRLVISGMLVDQEAGTALAAFDPFPNELVGNISRFAALGAGNDRHERDSRPLRKVVLDSF
jgi:hypothetical protein